MLSLAGGFITAPGRGQRDTQVHEHVSKSEVKSTASARPDKPAKRYPEFPLCAYAAGYWTQRPARKICTVAASWPTQREAAVRVTPYPGADGEERQGLPQPALIAHAVFSGHEAGRELDEVQQSASARRDRSVIRGGV